VQEHPCLSAKWSARGGKKKIKTPARVMVRSTNCITFLIKIITVASKRSLSLKMYDLFLWFIMHGYNVGVGRISLDPCDVGFFCFFFFRYRISY
jgi:hypothetical protein